MRNTLVRQGLLRFIDAVKKQGYVYLQHRSHYVRFRSSVPIDLYARYGWYTVAGTDGYSSIEETLVIATVNIEPQREGWFKILLAEALKVAEANLVHVAVESVHNPHLAAYLSSQGFKLVPVRDSHTYYKRTHNVNEV
jgi:hypothetical protein